MKCRIRILAFIGALCWFAATASASNLVWGFSPDATYQCTGFGNITSPLLANEEYNAAASLCNDPASGSPINSDQIPDYWWLAPTDNPSNSDIAVGSSNGTNYVSFMGAATDIGDYDCLVAYFNTPGASSSNPIAYTVSFSLAVTGTVGSNAVLIPEWNWFQQGDTENMVTYTPTSDTTGWVNFSFTEYAVQSTSNIMFHGVDAVDGVSSPSNAIELANVSVTEVSSAPEPASLLLIASALIMGALFCRVKYSPGIVKST